MASDVTVRMTPSYAKAVEKLGPSNRDAIKRFENKLFKGLDRPGLHVERIKGCKDERLRTARVDRDMRAVLLIDPLVLLYVDRHDQATAWALTHRISESWDRREIRVYEEPDAGIADGQAGEGLGPGLQAVQPRDFFERFTDEYLEETIGVPCEYIPLLRNLRCEEEVLILEGKLPHKVLERLIAIVEGRMPDITVGPSPEAEAGAEQPVVADAEELNEEVQGSLDLIAQGPRREWLLTLGSSQKKLTREHFDRPVLLTGPAGTGKTVVLLHRASVLAQLGARVLLVTSSKTLARALREDLELLVRDSQVRARVDTLYFHRLVEQLRDAAALAALPVPSGRIIYAGTDTMRDALVQAAKEVRGARMRRGLWYRDEWKYVIEPNGITALEDYLVVARSGRGEPLADAQRRAEWPVFERATAYLESSGCTTAMHVYVSLLEQYRAAGDRLPHWDHVLVDELQDAGRLSAQLALTLAGEPGGAFLAADFTQRTLEAPLEVDKLKANLIRRRLTRTYRTTEAIRRFVEVDLALRDQRDRYLGTRAGGERPEVHQFPAEQAEFEWIVERCTEWKAAGVNLSDVGVMAANKKAAQQLAEALRKRGVPCSLVREGAADSGVAVLHYHLAKGLEFDTVVVAQLTADVLEPHSFDWMPGDQRRELVAMRRNVAYVALSRARERLVVTCSGELPSALEGHPAVVSHVDPGNRAAESGPESRRGAAKHRPEWLVSDGDLDVSS